MSYIVDKFKGKYRILPEYDIETNDVPRNEDGSIADGYDDLFITCSFGNKIYYYGHGKFVAYIPSLGRGRNIIKKLNEMSFDYFDYRESDSEVEFKFKTADMDTVAELLKAKTSGATISPYSLKNFPKAKITIPQDDLNQYKEVISKVSKENLLKIHRYTQEFLENILQKKLKKQDKTFDYKSDMKKLKMARLSKEYIYSKNFWDEYLNFLNQKVNVLLGFQGVKK